MSLLFRVTLLLFALNQLLSPCEGYGSYGAEKYGGKSYKDPLQPQGPQTFVGSAGASAGSAGQYGARRGSGLSAWGIVIVILALILGGMGFYYFSMCYPILCKKERNYDMIQLDAV